MTTAPDKPVARFRLRVTRGDGIAIGPGKIALLEAIAGHGSILSAARSLGMSYRRAWLLVDEINRSLKKPAVESATGGRAGGGTTLTPQGEELIRLYREIEAQAERASARPMEQMLRMLAH